MVVEFKGLADGSCIGLIATKGRDGVTHSIGSSTSLIGFDTWSQWGQANLAPRIIALYHMLAMHESHRMWPHRGKNPLLVGSGHRQTSHSLVSSSNSRTKRVRWRHRGQTSAAASAHPRQTAWPQASDAWRSTGSCVPHPRQAREKWAAWGPSLKWFWR